MLNETQLNEFIHPLSTLKNKNYSVLRRDRIGRDGGGIIVYIRKEYIIRKASNFLSIEGISFQLTFNKKKF
jgi:hypothetical protein